MRPDLPLLVIAPSLYMTHMTARAFGLDPARAVNFRAIHKPQLLRGWVKGTPFIALPVEQWAGHAAAADLDKVVTARIADGTLRVAQEKDIKACMPEGELK